jgi:hypothetical protein
MTSRRQAAASTAANSTNCISEVCVRPVGTRARQRIGDLALFVGSQTPEPAKASRYLSLPDRKAANTQPRLQREFGVNEGEHRKDSGA